MLQLRCFWAGNELHSECWNSSSLQKLQQRWRNRENWLTMQTLALDLHQGVQHTTLEANSLTRKIEENALQWCDTTGGHNVKSILWIRAFPSGVLCDCEIEFGTIQMHCWTSLYECTCSQWTCLEFHLWCIVIQPGQVCWSVSLPAEAPWQDECDFKMFHKYNEVLMEMTQTGI